MMHAGFFFLLLLTGGDTSSLELQPMQDQQTFNQSSEEMPAGNNSSSEQPELHDDQQTFNQSSVEMPAGNNSSSELPELHDDQQAFFESSEENSGRCSVWAISESLNLTKDRDLYKMTRPVKDHNSRTEVAIRMVMNAILDVKETDQVLKAYVWIRMAWKNEFLIWNSSDFCGLKHIHVPKEFLWKPDLLIEETTDKNKAPSSRYLTIKNDGWTVVQDNQMVISACRMHVHRFPFDTQSCNISFKSIMYTEEEIQLLFTGNNTKVMARSRKMMRTQYEWVFLNMTAMNETDEYGITRIIYTISMSRRSALYIANLLLPILFFLCLDIASLLISDTGGEKLSYKITVLLAVTVMQLILNEILPSSSDRIPLIAVYCIGIFSLMLLSLLETVLVMHLIRKDSRTQDDETWGCWNKQVNCFRDVKQCTHCASVSDVSADETPSETREGSSCQLTKVSLALEKVSDELGEIEQTVSQLSMGKEEEKPGYWTRLAKKTHKVFAVCYITASILFLITIFALWAISED